MRSFRDAEIGTTIKCLLREIESTKRRVNAPEFKVIPELKGDLSIHSICYEKLVRD